MKFYIYPRMSRQILRNRLRSSNLLCLLQIFWGQSWRVLQIHVLTPPEKEYALQPRTSKENRESEKKARERRDEKLAWQKIADVRKWEMKIRQYKRRGKD